MREDAVGVETMNLTEFMREDLVFLNISARDKTDLFKKIVDYMAERQIIEHPRAFLDELIQREMQAPTYIGRGIAMPHTRTIFVSRPIIAFARLTPPLCFGNDAADVVELVFLMGTPKEDPDTYLRILGHLCKNLRETHFRKSLLAAQSTHKVLELLAHDNPPEPNDPPCDYHLNH